MERRAPSATAVCRRCLRNASGRIPPSRTKSRPSRTKKMGLDYLGFLRPIRGFSMGYGQSKSKMQLARWSLVAARLPASILLGPLPEAMGASGQSPWVTHGSRTRRLWSYGRLAFGSKTAGRGLAVDGGRRGRNFRARIEAFQSLAAPFPGE